MSSMTEEECITLSKLIPYETDAWKHIKTPIPLYIANIEQFDFFHRHHLDWRGLIQKGLALEAPEGMYEIGQNMNRFIMKCPYCGFECETGEMLPLEIMELNNMVIDCGNCGKEIKITKETFKESDQAPEGMYENDQI